MGLSEDIKKAREELKGLIDQFEGMSGGEDVAQAFRDAASSTEITVEALKEVNKLSKSLKTDIQDVNVDLGSIVSQFNKVVDSLTKGNTELSRQKNSLRSLSRIGSEILNMKEGEVSVTKSSISKLQNKLSFEKLQLKLLRDQHKEGSDAYEMYQAQINQIKGIQKASEDVLGIYQKTNLQLGFVPQTLGAIDKQMQKLGFPDLGVADALDKTQKLAQSAQGTQGILKTWGFFIKEFLKNLSSALSTANLLQLSFGFAVKLFTELDKAAGEFAKSQNVSYQEAMATRKEMSDLALKTGNVAVNSQRLMESQMAIGNALGTNAKLNKADLVTMTEMTRMAGMTHEEMVGIQKISLVNGKSLKQNTKEILGAAKAQASKNGLVVNEKQILKDVSKASSSLTLSLGNNPTLLAEAVVQAKQFGLTLEQADKIAEGLLNFEQSISNELEAELLLGKDLNFETARQLALNNDIAGAAAEVAKQVGTSADFAKMNRIQQEAIAKSAGLSRDELAKSLMDREALIALGAKEGQDAQARYNELVSQGKSRVEIANELGDTELENAMHQQSVQEQFNDTMLELKEMLINGLLPAFQTMGTFLKENMGIVKSIVKLLIAAKVAQITFNAVKAVSNALTKKGAKESQKEATKQIFGGAFKSFGTVPVVGAALALAAALGAIALMNSTAADDMLSPGKGGGGYGDRTLFGPEGAISLNNKDTVIAGTNLFGDDVKSKPGKATEMAGKGEIQVKGGGDMSAVISAINTLSGNLNALASRPIEVSIDGSKVITATTDQRPNETGGATRRNSYQVQ